MNTEASDLEKHLVNIDSFVELTFPANGPDTMRACIPVRYAAG